MFSARVQLDTGESLPITRLDGHFAGNSILTFMMSVLSYCDHPQGAGSPLDRLSAQARGALCAACSGLMKSTINSQWNYCDGEDYQSYASRTGDHDLGEASFIRAAAHYQSAWADVTTLLSLAQMAIVQMEMAPSIDRPDLLSGAALLDFRALHATLDTALARGAKRARLDIH
jgi:hypothetical protein